MLRKTTAAVVLLAALALGTASATSLGDFNSPTFAASDVALLDCEVEGDLLKLLPDIPEPGEDLSTLTGATLSLLELDVRPVTTALAALDDGIDDPCITETVLDLVLLDSSGTVLDVIQVDPDALTGLDAVSLNEIIDVATVAEVRAILRNAPVA